MPAEGALCDGLGATDRLIETLRFEPKRGCVRLNAHLERLRRSAEALAFHFERNTIEAALSDTLQGRDEALRVRLTLDRDGEPEVTVQPFQPLPPHAEWTVAISTVRLNSKDALLQHKTTRRQVYEAARAEYGIGQVQEVLLRNEDNQLCEGTITNLFLPVGDTLLTPPLRCGLLPGILRAELLASGRAREALLVERDLVGASFFVGNALRGLIRARLQS